MERKYLSREYTDLGADLLLDAVHQLALADMRDEVARVLQRPYPVAPAER